MPDHPIFVKVKETKVIVSLRAHLPYGVAIRVDFCHGGNSFLPDHPSIKVTLNDKERIHIQCSESETDYTSKTSSGSKLATLSNIFLFHFTRK